MGNRFIALPRLLKCSRQIQVRHPLRRIDRQSLLPTDNRPVAISRLRGEHAMIHQEIYILGRVAQGLLRKPIGVVIVFLRGHVLQQTVAGRGIGWIQAQRAFPCLGRRIRLARFQFPSANP